MKPEFGATLELSRERMIDLYEALQVAQRHSHMTMDARFNALASDVLDAIDESREAEAAWDSEADEERRHQQAERTYP